MVTVRSRWRRWAGVGVIAGVVAVAGLAWPQAGPPIAGLPGPGAAIEAVGRRLGQRRSPGELTEIGRHADRVLGELTRGERWTLGRDAVRFRVDRPCRVAVLAPAKFPPFWLRDLGFVATGETTRNDDGTFAVHARSYPAGVVGLGVNALAPGSPSQYAVLVRADDGSSVRVEPVGPGLGPVTTSASEPFCDQSRPFAGKPAGWDRAVFVQTAKERGNEGVLARGRVWKARNVSGPKPDQIVVSLGEDPARGLAWTWRTGPETRQTALRIARADRPEAVRVVAGDAVPIRSVGLLNDPVVLRHRVSLADLEPDTAYRYAVGDGTDAGWSGWQTVRTGPSVLRDFGFLYLGDAQCGLERWGELMGVMHRHRPDAGFAILAGDLVDRGNERTNWDHFFQSAGAVFGSIPLMPAVGNHEYLDLGPQIYRRTFHLPDNGPAGVDRNLIYSFEYADAFVAVLDSNTAINDPDDARKQAEWLDAALSRTRATWRFVSFHHPVYASHPTREYPQLEPVWAPVFERHGVDLVLQGHDHAYLRTPPMRGGHPAPSDDPDRAPIYLVSVSGEKFCDQNPRDYTAKGLTNLATYQTIDVRVRERTLTYRAWDRDGREVDQLVLTKPERPAGPLADRRAGVAR